MAKSSIFLGKVSYIALKKTAVEAAEIVFGLKNFIFWRKNVESNHKNWLSSCRNFSGCSVTTRSYSTMHLNEYINLNLKFGKQWEKIDKGIYLLIPFKTKEFLCKIITGENTTTWKVKIMAKSRPIVGVDSKAKCPYKKCFCSQAIGGKSCHTTSYQTNTENRKNFSTKGI